MLFLLFLVFFRVLKGRKKEGRFASPLRVPASLGGGFAASVSSLTLALSIFDRETRTAECLGKEFCCFAGGGCAASVSSLMLAYYYLTASRARQSFGKGILPLRWGLAGASLGKLAHARHNL